MPTNYFPEGSYWISREMFRNETVDGDLVNFTKTFGDMQVYSGGNPPLLSDTERKYLGVIEDIGAHTIINNSRLHELVNDFRQELIWIVGFWDDTDNVTANDYFGFSLYDGSNNLQIDIKLYGTGILEVTDLNTANIYQTAVGKFGKNKLIELKLEISGSNDPFRPEHECRIYVEGNEYCLDSLGNFDIYDGVGNHDTRFLLDIATGKVSHYEFEIFQTVNIDQFLTYVSWKNFADMTDREEIPFREIIILSNDLATFIPLTTVTRIGELNTDPVKYSVRNPINQIYSADIPLFTEDSAKYIARNITGEDAPDSSDNNQNHFTYNAELRIFLQTSRIVYEGEDGFTGGALAPTTFTDFNGTFITSGVQEGDWLYTWHSSDNHDTPRQITNVFSNISFLVDPVWTDPIQENPVNYTIVRGQSRNHTRYLGDYIFIGQFKRYQHKIAAKKTGISLIAYDYGFHMTKKPLWCWATKYREKDFDEILQGWTQDLFTVELGGVRSYGPSQGILSASIFKPLYDSNITELGAIYTQIFRQNTYIIDAIREMCNVGNLQFDNLLDAENGYQIYTRFRVILDKSLTQTTFIDTLNAPPIDVTENNKLLLDGNVSKGSDKLIDYVRVDGARVGTESGVAISQKYPVTGGENRYSEVMVETDEYIWADQTARQKAKAIYDDSHKMPPEGLMKTEYFPPYDTRNIPDTITWFNDGVETYPGSGIFISHVTDQTRSADGSSHKDIFGAQKHSQGKTYRFPYNRTGETGKIVFDSDVTYPLNLDFVIYELITNYSNDGLYSMIRPETRRWIDVDNMADIKRDIDRIAQNFIDPQVNECVVLPEEELLSLIDYVGVGMNLDAIVTAVDQGAQISLLNFEPFTFLDEDNSDSAYSYMFFYRATGAGIGVAWNRASVIGQPVGPNDNEIIDIDNSTLAPLVVFGAGGGSNYLYDPTPPPVNGLNKVKIQLPGTGTYDIMVVLRIQLGGVLIPANNPPTPSSDPGAPPKVPTPEQDDEILETADGGAQSMSNGVIAIIDWSSVTVA